MDKGKNDKAPVTRAGKTGARAGAWAGPFAVEKHSDRSVVLDRDGNRYCQVITGADAPDKVAGIARATLIAEALNRTEPIGSPEGQGSSVGSHKALLQGLTALAASRRADGAQGHALIAERAAAALTSLEKHVTRYLTYPGTVVDHPKLGQLAVQAAHCEDGDVTLAVEGTPGNLFKVKLSEVVPAGPVADAVRTMIQLLVADVMRTALAKAKVRAGLLDIDRPKDAHDCEACLQTGFCGKCGGTGFVVPHDGNLVPLSIRQQADKLAADQAQAGVHHLGAHDTYVIEPDGHCEPQTEKP